MFYFYFLLFYLLFRPTETECNGKPGIWYALWASSFCLAHSYQKKRLSLTDFLLLSLSFRPIETKRKGKPAVSMPFGQAVSV